MTDPITLFIAEVKTNQERLRFTCQSVDYVCEALLSPSRLRSCYNKSESMKATRC